MLSVGSLVGLSHLHPHHDWQHKKVSKPKFTTQMLILIPYVSPKYRFGHTEKGNRDSSTFLESYLSRGNTAQTKGDFPGL